MDASTSIDKAGPAPHFRMTCFLIVFLFVLSAVNFYLYLNYSPPSTCVNLHLRFYRDDFSKSEDGWNVFRRKSGRKLRNENTRREKLGIKISGETEEENLENILLSGKYCLQVASYSGRDILLGPEEEKERIFDSIGRKGNEKEKVESTADNGGGWKRRRRSGPEVAQVCQIQVTPKVIEHEGGTREITNDLCIEESTLEKYIRKTVNHSLETILGRIANESENRDHSEAEAKEEKGEEEAGGEKDCVLAKIEEAGSYEIPEDARGKSFLLTTDPFREESDDEFSVWIKEFGSPHLREYLFQTNGSYKIVGSHVLPAQFYKYGMVYDRSFYSEYKELKVIGKYDLERKKMSTVKEMYDGFFFNDKIMFFFADQNGLWICYYSHLSYAVLRVDPENLEILSKQNNVSPDCYLYRVFIAYGRVYCVRDQEDTINVLHDFYQRDIRNISVDFHPHEFPRYGYTFSYNYKTRHLYVYNGDIFKRYKLYFNCSHPHSPPAGERGPHPSHPPTIYRVE